MLDDVYYEVDIIEDIDLAEERRTAKGNRAQRRRNARIARRKVHSCPALAGRCIRNVMKYRLANMTPDTRWSDRWWSVEENNRGYHCRTNYSYCVRSEVEAKANKHRKNLLVVAEAELEDDIIEDTESTETIERPERENVVGTMDEAERAESRYLPFRWWKTYRRVECLFKQAQEALKALDDEQGLHLVYGVQNTWDRWDLFEAYERLEAYCFSELLYDESSVAYTAYWKVYNLICEVAWILGIQD